MAVAKIEVCEAFVRGRFTTPKSRASRRVVELRPRTLAVLEEQWQRTAYRSDEDHVFGHPMKGTPVDTSKLAKRYLKPALARAAVEKPFRPFHDLRDTSLAHAAAAGNPQIYVQGGTKSAPPRPTSKQKAPLSRAFLSSGGRI